MQQPQSVQYDPQAPVTYGDSARNTAVQGQAAQYGEGQGYEQQQYGGDANGEYGYDAAAAAAAGGYYDANGQWVATGAEDVQYDAYGYPIQFDEQGNAYDCYGQLIYQDYYGNPIYGAANYGGAENGGANYADPYNVAGAGAAAQPAYDPYGGARQAYQPAVAPATPPAAPASPAAEKRKKKKKKKAVVPQFLVTVPPSSKPATPARETIYILNPPPPPPPPPAATPKVVVVRNGDACPPAPTAESAVARVLQQAAAHLQPTPQAAPPTVVLAPPTPAAPAAAAPRLLALPPVTTQFVDVHAHRAPTQQVVVQDRCYGGVLAAPGGACAQHLVVHASGPQLSQPAAPPSRSWVTRAMDPEGREVTHHVAQLSGVRARTPCRFGRTAQQRSSVDVYLVRSQVRPSPEPVTVVVKSPPRPPPTTVVVEEPAPPPPQPAVVFAAPPHEHGRHHPHTHFAACGGGPAAPAAVVQPLQRLAAVAAGPHAHHHCTPSHIHAHGHSHHGHANCSAVGAIRLPQRDACSPGPTAPQFAIAAVHRAEPAAEAPSIEIDEALAGDDGNESVRRGQTERSAPRVREASSDGPPASKEVSSRSGCCGSNCRGKTIRIEVQPREKQAVHSSEPVCVRVEAAEPPSSPEVEFAPDLVPEAILVEQNLHLQKEINELRQQLFDTLGTKPGPELSLDEQNAALKNQTKALTLAVSQFANEELFRDEENREPADGLIGELAAQLAQARQEADMYRQKYDGAAATVASQAEELRERTLVAEAFEPPGHIRVNEDILPLQADDLKHQAALLDDLIGQCQRAVAEATDRLWVAETGVRDLLDQLLGEFGLNESASAKRLLKLLRDPKIRTAFLARMHETARDHVDAVFQSRRQLDLVQQRLENLQARAWDPKRNLPYCGCRPRRDLLEDDVAHLMQRLTEAASQTTQLRERLLNQELTNLRQQAELAHAGVDGENVRTAALRAEFERERAVLFERIQDLEGDRQRRERPNMAEAARALVARAVQGRETGGLERARAALNALARDVSKSPTAAGASQRAASSDRRSSHRVGSDRASSLAAGGGRASVGPRKPSTQISTSSSSDGPAAGGRGRKQRQEHKLLKKLQKEKEDVYQFREAIANDLRRQEAHLKHFTRAMSSTKAWRGNQHELIHKLNEGSRDVRKMLHSINEQVIKEDDDLNRMASDLERRLDPSKLTDKERQLLQAVQTQAQRLMATTVKLRNVATAAEDV